MKDSLRKSKIYILLFYIIAQVFNLWRFILPSSLEVREQYLVMVGLALLVLFVSISYLKDSGQLSIFRMKKPRLSTLAWMVVVTIIDVGLGNFVFTFITTNSESRQVIEEFIWKTSYSGGNLLFSIIMIDSCLLAPLSEEVFFRGALMTHFFKDSKYYLDVVFSSVLFSLGHLEILDFQVLHFLYFLIPGLGYGFLVRKTKSIYPSLILHCLWNIYASWRELEILFNHIGLWIKLNFN